MRFRFGYVMMENLLRFRFGSVMLENLLSRGCQLAGVAACKDTQSQISRLESM